MSEGGKRTENSYLVYEGKVSERRHKYHCKLCGNKNLTVKVYSESNIPISCGCINNYKPRSKDLTGENINGILVYGYMAKGVWKVRYSCGHYGELHTGAVKGDRVTSLCKNCVSKLPNTLSHGHAKRSGYSSEYISWMNMRRRCNNDNHNRYKFYKGKGITYPEKWESFSEFLKDMGHKPEENYTIERLNVDLPYSKNNCVWASTKVQANNKSNNILILKQGDSKPMSLKHWCDLEGVDYKKAHYRFKYKGDSIESILGKGYSLK